MAWNRQDPIAPIQQPQAQPQILPKILIAIPHEARMYAEWSYRMLGPLAYQSVPWCQKAHNFARGVPLPVARDQLVEAMLGDPTITHIMWVDTDNVCVKKNDKGDWEAVNPNDAMRMLYECNQPIVSGLYRAKQATGFNYAMWMDIKDPSGKPGFVAIQDFTGNWLQVDTIGMGFVLVQRKVYETVPRPWHPWATPSPSEDFNFSIAARKAGFMINVFTEVKLRHLGELAVNPDGTFSVLTV